MNQPVARPTFRITVLVDDVASRSPELGSEHGLSFLVERGGAAGLFDTGQSDLVVRNARALGIDLVRLSWIVLSHGHYDHTGGLPAVLAEAKDVRLYAHPEAFAAKFVRGPGGAARPAGSPLGRADAEALGARILLHTGPAVVAEEITATGAISRHTDFEDVSTRFLTEQHGSLAHDTMLDDQALVLSTPEGLVILLGCAHSGVVNTLAHVWQVMGARPIRAVVGGMHLGNASPERIDRTIAALKEYNVASVGLAHCTGRAASRALEEAYGSDCFECRTRWAMAF